MPKQEYSREDVRRMLGVSEQQLRGWERQGLVRGPEVFSFKDLIALRTLLKLRENRISTQKIGLAVASLKQKSPVSSTLFRRSGFCRTAGDSPCRSQDRRWSHQRPDPV